MPGPAPTPTPTGGVTDATSTGTADWACIRQHESNDNYAEGNGGAYQFELGTWNALTGLPSPAEDYPPATQDACLDALRPERNGVTDVLASVLRILRKVEIGELQSAAVNETPCGKIH